MGVKRKVVHQNIDLVFPQMSLDQKRLFEKKAYSHLGSLALEVPLVFSGMKRVLKNQVELVGKEHWEQAKAHGKGVFFLSSHVGNWEIMAAIGGLHEMNLMMVTKKLKPDWFHSEVERGRRSYGVNATYEPKTLRDVLRHLKRNGTVGMVLDQYAGPPVGYRVPFLGQIVGTSSALATLVKRTGARVVPVVNYRVGLDKMVVRIEKPIEWIQGSEEEEIAINTAHYAGILEHHVREFPEQWLWIHRRFKGELGTIEPNEWKKRVRR